MANEKSIKVGCGATSFNKNEVIMVCDYSTPNLIGERVYTTGETASSCSNGRDATYNSLCAASEHGVLSIVFT